MFLKDEYIVVLKTTLNNSDCVKTNFIFKQSSNLKFIAPIIDLKGDSNNNNTSSKFDKSDTLRDWRYATEDEAKEYERLGKPYDVTTLPKFILPKKWCCNITNEEEKETLNEFIKNNGYTGNLSHYYYIHYPLMNGGGSAFSKIQKGYIEITYSQFLKYVLGEEVIEVKEDLSYLIEFLTLKGIK